MKGKWLEDLTWPEAAEMLKGGTPVIVPIGARAKEHGHHLPLKTDYMMARALCDGIARELPVVIAPVIDFGYYPAFVDYPGSQHLSAATFIALIEEVVGGFVAQGVRKIAIVNTGVSTEGPVQIAARAVQEKHGVQIAVADVRRLGKSSGHILEQKLGGHGDEHETSIILAVDPGVVRMDLARRDYGNMESEPPSVFYRPVRFSADPASGTNYTETGVRGDPTLASAEKGRVILAAMIGDLVEGLRALGADSA